MKTITLLNEKGGVGKTTLSILLASELARRGFLTLLIDADSQGHATLGVRAKRRDGLHALFTTDASLDNIIIPIAQDFYENESEQPKLWLIPSSSETGKIPLAIAAQKTSIYTLRNRIKPLQGSFDFVIIDTSPSISDLHAAFYVASDYILYPTECTYMPMQGLFKSLKHLEAAQQKLSETGVSCANVLGIVPSKFNGRESVQHQNLGYLRGKYGDELVFSPVRRLTAWEQASQFRTPVTLYESRSSEAAKDASRFVDEVLERLKVGANVEA